MSKLTLVHIKKDYIDYLRNHDNKVQHNYDQEDRNTKPYIGVILNINEKDFFAPLTKNTAAKRKRGKFNKFSEDNISLQLIRDPSSKNNILAAISINNMIPVSPDLYEKLDFRKITDNAYLTLLKKEIKYINDHRRIIQKKADLLYKAVTKGDRKYINHCCNFSLLEECLDKYSELNRN